MLFHHLGELFRLALLASRLLSVFIRLFPLTQGALPGEDLTVPHSFGRLRVLLVVAAQKRFGICV